MSRKNNVFGFAISPTYVHGVRLSVKQFAIDKSVSYELAHATLSHDGKRLLDAESLEDMVTQVARSLGNQQPEEPLFLAMHTPWMGVYRGNTKDYDNLEEKLFYHVLGSHVEDAADKWVVQCQMLWEQDEEFALAYAFFEKPLLQDVSRVFHASHFHISAIDLIPFTVLRALAGSGVLDALLQQIGNEVVWGMVGLCGSQTWVTLWQASDLVAMTSFATPTDQKELERHILRTGKEIGIESVRFWFSWQEKDSNQPFQLLKLNLNAPIRPALAGPRFQKKNDVIPSAALGAAFKADIVFPMGWNFLNESVLVDAFAEDLLEPLAVPETQLVQVPSVTQSFDPDKGKALQATSTVKEREPEPELEPAIKDVVGPAPVKQKVPIIPQLFLLLSIITFIVVIAASVYLRVQNQKHAVEEKTFAEAFSAQWQNQKKTNAIYADSMPWVKEKVLAQQFPIRTVRIAKDSTITMQGQYENTTQLDDLVNQLSASNTQPEGLVDVKKSAAPLEAGIQFKVSGRLQALRSRKAVP